jgi:hypothetical protein
LVFDGDEENLMQPTGNDQQKLTSNVLVEDNAEPRQNIRKKFIFYSPKRFSPHGSKTTRIQVPGFAKSGRFFG